MELPDIRSLFFLFSDAALHEGCTWKTSREQTGDTRAYAVCETENGDKYVLKLADNDFSSPDRVAVWQRCIEGYRSLGYECPRILRAKDGSFPLIPYGGHTFTAYLEEYSPYKTADRFPTEHISENGYYTYLEDAITMNARVAAMHWDFAPFPSAWCAFETFCPSDPCDEVLEDAQNWMRTADALPEEFRSRTQSLRERWLKNRAALQAIYAHLPTSVFQADINHTNILLDENGTFRGVLDFNICGRETVLNYLFREAPYVMTVRDFEQPGDTALKRIRLAAAIAKRTYHFSPLEIEAAPLLYRYTKALWCTGDDLAEAKDDPEKIRAALDATERILTAEIDWAAILG